MGPPWGFYGSFSFFADSISGSTGPGTDDLYDLLVDEMKRGKIIYAYAIGKFPGSD
jgi:hypothetical protein